MESVKELEDLDARVAKMLSDRLGICRRDDAERNVYYLGTALFFISLCALYAAHSTPLVSAED